MENLNTSLYRTWVFKMPIGMEFYFNQLKLKAKILHEINGSYIRKAKPLDRKKITNTKLIIIARKI